MPAVTLLSPKMIQIKPHYTEYDVDFINTRPAKDFILKWLTNRIPSQKGGIPNIKPTGVSDRIMIIRAGTGSGKSTTFAPELYIAFYQIFKKDIAITQPRVLTAETIPLEIVGIPTYAQHIRMGKELGYSTGENKYKPANGGIIFMSAGVLSQQLKTMTDETFMQLYCFIIIDECHDRGTDNYLVLSMLKGLITRNWGNSECPFVILTSATFDFNHYATWMGVDPKNVIYVEGMNYPIHENFLEAPCADMSLTSAAKAIEIHLANASDYAKPNSRETDILIFVSGMGPIKLIRKTLDEANEKNTPGNHYIVLALTGDSFKAGDKDYQSIFKPLVSLRVPLKSGEEVIPQRRIIISTDVAETGVTIDTLRYLIDTGFVNDSVYDPIHSAYGLLLKNVSQASARQRKGRVGRRFIGYWYPMYTEETFNKMPSDKLADLLTANITSVLLGIIIKKTYPLWNNDFASMSEVGKPGAFKITDIDMLDPIPSDNVANSLERLYVLGFINPDMTPTPLGLMANGVMMISPENTRMILAGYQHGAYIMDLITIAAFIGACRDRSDYLEDNKKERKPFDYEILFTGAFEKRRERKETPQQSKKDLLIRMFLDDDFIEPIFVWNEFCEQMAKSRKREDLKEWATSRHIKLATLLKVSAARDNIISSFIGTLGMNIKYNSLGKDKYSLIEIINQDLLSGIDEIRKIKRCILDGYRLNVLQWNEKLRSYVMRCGKPVALGRSMRDYRIYSKIKSFRQYRPITIITSEINIRKKMDNTGYGLELSRISPLDMYIDYDEKYIAS